MHDIAAIKSRLDPTIAKNDPMFGGSLDHYLGVGESALRCIFGAQISAGVERPNSVLDFACLSGRVTRWLRAAYPEADLHVADLELDWVDTTATAFKATGWASTEAIIDVKPPRAFDLIWCGSLVTHLPEELTIVLLGKLHEWLAPNGIAVATTCGRKFADYGINRTVPYFEDMKQLEPLLAELAFSGYGFQPYPGQAQGISACAPAWMIGQILRTGARVVSFCEHGWDNHQDVFAFQRVV